MSAEVGAEVMGQQLWILIYRGYLYTVKPFMPMHAAVTMSMHALAVSWVVSLEPAPFWASL